MLWSGEERRRVFAVGAIFRGLAALPAGAIGALIGVISYRVVWLISAGFFLAAFILLVQTVKNHGEPLVRLKEKEAWRRSWQALRERSALKWATASAMIFGLIVPFNHYWAPLFNERVGKSNLWFVWLALYGAVTLSGIIIRQIRVRHGEENHWLMMASMSAGLGMIGLFVSSGLFWSLFFVMLHEIGRGAFQPLLDNFTQHHIESGYRATYGSLQSLLGRTGFAITLFGVWFLTLGQPATTLTMTTVLLICGSILVLASLILWLFFPHHRAAG